MKTQPNQENEAEYLSGSICRRQFARLAVVGAVSLSTALAQPATALTQSDEIPVSGRAEKNLSAFDDMMINLLRTHHFPGAALAVTRNSKVVYSRGFGYADIDTKSDVQPTSTFRIASVSKLITAVAIFQLIEKNKLKLDDKVFSRLPAKDWLPENFDDRLQQITVLHLLQHTAGWDRDVSFDPIIRAPAIAKKLNKTLPVGPKDVIRYMLTFPLDFDPGTRFAYSNIGYLLLGRLIEVASGQSYFDFVKDNILTPIGAAGMKLARACYEDFGSDEVRYYDSKKREAVAVCGSKLGTRVPLVYGGINVEAYEAHGGWVGSVEDLVKFAAAFDDPKQSILLKSSSLARMIQRPEGSAGAEADGRFKPYYCGCGWHVRPIGNSGQNLWHFGLISGTSALLVRRHDGLNWAALFNTDADADGKSPAELVDHQIHKAANSIRNWPS